MTFIDLFAGIGGMRRGMELAGHECVGFCEFDKFAVASYTSMHLITEDQREYLSTLPLKQRQKEILKEEYRNGEWYSNDIRNVDARSVPRCDCWCFGAPCQDFSIAGKRAGLDGERSSLIREVFRIIREIEEENRPEWLIYENVKGMLSSNRGGDYLAILMEMDELGYDIEWQNINSKYYVPQNRERIYTVGHLRAKGAAKILPIIPTDGENSICEVNLIGHRENYRRNMQVFDPDGITEALDTATGGGRGHHVAVKCEPKINYIANYSSGNQRSGIMSTDGISRCLFATDHKQPPSVAVNVNSVVIPVLTPERAVKRQNGRRFKDNGDESFTLTAQDRHGVAIEIRTTEDGFHQFRNDKKRSSIQGTHVTYPTGKTHALSTTHIPMTLEKINICEDEEHQGYYVELEDGCVVYAMWYEKYQCYITIRKLTPKECFRLQGWSDEYFERAALFNSDSQLYKQAGNGVTVNVVYEIGKAILRRGEE